MIDNRPVDPYHRAVPASSRRSASACLVVVALVVAGCAASDPPSVLVAGREVYGKTCSVCHGNAGEGAVGPALGAVDETWPDCGDQIRWITLGSEGWRAEVGDTYGATQKPVLGGMLAQGGVLTPAEIAAVAAFERITYGGVDEVVALADCGVADPSA